jgi:hypothetical protein
MSTGRGAFDPTQHRGGNSGVGAAANFDPAANDAARLWISFQWTVDGLP